MAGSKCRCGRRVRDPPSERDSKLPGVPSTLVHAVALIGPNTQRQASPGHSGSPHFVDGDDEVESRENRRAACEQKPTAGGRMDESV